LTLKNGVGTFNVELNFGDGQIQQYSFATENTIQITKTYANIGNYTINGRVLSDVLNINPNIQGN
jgi:hypothetical protein